MLDGFGHWPRLRRYQNPWTVAGPTEFSKRRRHRADVVRHNNSASFGRHVQNGQIVHASEGLTLEISGQADGVENRELSPRRSLSAWNLTFTEMRARVNGECLRVAR